MSQDLVAQDLLEEPRSTQSGFSPGSVLLIGALVVIVLIIGIALARQLQTQPETGPAPEFTLTTFNGEIFRFGAQRGKVVVVNFWASWCVPCRDEAPILQSMWERYRDRGVVLVGIAYADTESNSLAFIDEFGITYPNGPDVGTRISEDYRITGVPETFVIDQAGNIVDLIIAPVQEGQLDAIIDDLLVTER
ncbi:MAG: redoxin domain-containing protein [Anaerolineae bacterium]|nr:redoxin domain-containing protein [Anaerolineae bacterium]